MKKVEEKYYCDLCGKECEHTPNYVLPELSVGSFQNVTPNSKQKDLCHEREKEVASIMRLLKGKHSISAMNQNGESFIIVR